MITRAIPYLLTAALSAYAAWAWQANTYTRQIAVIQTEYAQAQHRAVEVAHAETIRLAAQAQSAQRTAEARRRCALLITLALCLSLSGCASQPTAPPVAVQVPPAPTPHQPIPPQSYSESVRQLLLTWRGLLTGTR